MWRTSSTPAGPPERPKQSYAPTAVPSPPTPRAPQRTLTTTDDVTGVCVFGVWDAVCALLAGSKVAMLPPESITDGGDVLGRYLCDNKVTRTMLTPSLAELLVAAAAHAESVHAREALDAMRVVVLCGETPRVRPGGRLALIATR